MAAAGDARRFELAVQVPAAFGLQPLAQLPGQEQARGEYGAYYRERIAALGSSYYAPDNSPVVQKLYNDDLRASLDAAIESLPPKCREVFRLSYIEDLSNREIGEQLGISPRTVENHMYAALKQLRRKLSKEQLLLLLSLLFMRGV